MNHSQITKSRGSRTRRYSARTLSKNYSKQPLQGISYLKCDLFHSDISTYGNNFSTILKKLQYKFADFEKKEKGIIKLPKPNFNKADENLYSFGMETMDYRKNQEGKRLMNMRSNQAFINSQGEYDLKGIDSDLDDYISRSGFHQLTDSEFETVTAKNMAAKGNKKTTGVRTVGGGSFSDEDEGDSGFESVRVYNYNPQ